MTDQQGIECPACGKSNPLPEGRSGTPVCVSCYKALPIGGEALQAAGKVARQKLERERPVATSVEAFIAKVRHPGKNPWPAIMAGGAAFVALVIVFQWILSPPPAPRELCKKGDMEACIALGYLYETDRTLQNGLVEALTLYKQACNGGSDEGCRTMRHFLTVHPEQRLFCSEDEERCLKVKERVG